MLIKKYWMMIVTVVSVILAENNSDWKINTWGFYTFYKIGKGYREPEPKKDVDFTGAWLYDLNAGLKIEKCLENNVRFRLHIGGGATNQITDLTKENREFLTRRFAFYLLDAAIERTFIVNEKKKVLLEFGYLPVRYNPQASNLGEYLFGRSTPYPAVIESGFETADKEKIMGFHINYSMNFLNSSLLKLDNYIFTETARWPIGDISEAFLATTNIENIIEVGGGINFHHLISVDKRQTTPGIDTIRLKGNFNLHAYRTPLDTVGEKDLWDTTLYTARGIKLMSRITINPNALIKWSTLGPEDLKIYAEMAVLGLKNYPGWYENIEERIPVMFGFNIPTFKLLDVLSIQLQWFGSKYYNTWENQFKEGKFVPYVVANRPDLNYDIYKADSTMQTTDDDWKWSIYLSRKFNNRVRLSLQFANDNTFKNKYMPGPPYGFINYTEICHQSWAKDADGKSLFGRVHNWYVAGRIMFYM